MANQMIALQARNPQLPDPARQNAQYASMMNMAAQQRTSQRQAEQAQQTMDINAAREARDVAMQEPNLREAGFKADAAQIKMLTDFSKFSINALQQSQSPEDAVIQGNRLKAQFTDPHLQDSIDQTVAKLTADPANFEPMRQQLLYQSMEADKQLEQAVANMTTGEETYQVSGSKYAGAPGGMGRTEIPGTRVKTPQGIVYIKGSDGSLIPMPKTMPGTGGPSGTSTPTQGQSNTKDVVYGKGKFGLPSQALSSMTIGGVQDYQRKELIPNTRGKVGAGPDKGTGAVGTYQITYNTLKDYAPQVLGSNWREVPFTADVQEKVAKAIYEDNKGGNLKNTWAGLPANKPGAYANVPWSQVRDKIIQVESGGGGNRGTATSGNGMEFGKPIPGTGKPPASAMSPEKKRARDTAVQNLFDIVVDANKKGHLLSESNSYVGNRAQQLREGRTYVPGGVAQKSSLDLIESTAAQLLRQMIEKGTSGTLNAAGEQKTFLKGVGGADSTYEARIQTIRNFAKQNGIPLRESPATKTNSASKGGGHPAGVTAEEWQFMTPEERAHWKR